MLFSTTLLLLVPFVFSAPIQQWPINNDNDHFNINNPQDVLKDDSRISTSTMNLVMHDDIQAYYENIVDEIISTRSEDVLVKLARSMNNQQSRESLLQPQAIALLNHPVQDACLARMPGMIAQQLHRLHAKVLDSIEPTLDTLLQTYPMMITEINDIQSMPQDINVMQYQLAQLNTAMDEHVMQILTQAHLEHKVALQLAVCENQLTSSPPHRSLWLLLKNIWLNAAQSAKSSSSSSLDQLDNDNNNDMMNDDGTKKQEQNAALFVSGPSLLGSHMDAVTDNLHLEFEGRLMDLYTTLRSDLFDEEVLA